MNLKYNVFQVEWNKQKNENTKVMEEKEWKD